MPTNLDIYHQATEAGLGPIEAAFIAVGAEKAELEREARLQKFLSEHCTGPIVTWVCVNHEPAPCPQCEVEVCVGCGDRCYCT